MKQEERKERELRKFISNDESRRMEDYSIVGDFVNCKGTVKIKDSDLLNGRLPFSFGMVNDFDCSYCKDLISLDNFPEVINNSLDDILTTMEIQAYLNKIYNAYECKKEKIQEQNQF